LTYVIFARSIWYVTNGWFYRKIVLSGLTGIISYFTTNVYNGNSIYAFSPLDVDA